MSRPVGRPTTGTRIAIRIPPDTLAAIDRRAADQATTRANIIRTIIEAGIQQQTERTAG